MHISRPDPIPLPIPASQIVDVGPRGELVATSGVVYSRSVRDGLEAWGVDASLSPPAGLRWTSLRTMSHGRFGAYEAYVATTREGATYWLISPEEGWLEGEPFDREHSLRVSDGGGASVATWRATSHATVATCRDADKESRS